MTTNPSLADLFAVTQVTTRRVLWAGVALDKTAAAKRASEALRTRVGASWHVCPAADLPDGGVEAIDRANFDFSASGAA